MRDEIAAENKIMSHSTVFRFKNTGGSQTHTTGVSGASPADEPTVTTMADTQPADKTHK